MNQKWEAFAKTPNPKAMVRQTPENIDKVIQKAQEFMASNPDETGSAMIEWALADLFQIRDGLEVSSWKKAVRARLQAGS